MTRDEAIVLLKDWLARPDDTALDSKIIRQMQYVQSSICENGITLPWFLLTEHLTIDTVAGEERLPLPTNFLREHEECSLWVQDSSTGKWEPLTKDDYDALIAAYPNEGKPKKYALDKYFRLKPTPDKIYSIRQRVYVADTTLTTNVENKWLKHAGDWFLNEVARVTALRVLRDTELAAEFASEAEKGRQKLFVVDEARKHVNRDYQMGD